MEIPISSIVDVSIAVSATAASTEGFGTLLIVTKEPGPLNLTERIRTYSSIDGVAEDWDTSSEAYAAANTYFSQSPSPDSLMIGVRYEDAQSGVLISGSVSDDDLTTLQGITDGSFKIQMGQDDAEEFTGLDFSAETGWNGIATVIQTALQTGTASAFGSATVEYDDGQLYVYTGDTGEDTGYISYMSDATSGTAIADTLSLTQGNSLKAEGVDAETIADSLSNLNDINNDWYGFCFTNEVRDDATVNDTDYAVDTAAAWAESRVKIYFTTSNDEFVLKSASTFDVAYRLNSTNYSRTLVMYSTYPSQYPEVSVAGRAFTVDFTSGNPSITLKFKNLPGVTTEDLTTNQKTNLENKSCNVFYSVAGNDMLAEGVMADGTFFDQKHGLDWLENNIETAVFNKLYTSTTKIPYTDAGIQIIAQAVRGALQDGVDAGLLAAGEDSSGNLLPDGYSVTVGAADDQSSSDVAARLYSGISFTALGAGAIHFVEISGTFET